MYTGSGNRWLLQEDGKTVANYNTTDLRISVVYRARCFSREEERDAYLGQSEWRMTEGMQLDDVLLKLKDYMDAAEHEGTLYEGSTTSVPVATGPLENTPEKRLKLALLMDYYFRYPLPRRYLSPNSWNCALPKMLPKWLGRRPRGDMLNRGCGTEEGLIWVAIIYSKQGQWNILQ